MIKKYKENITAIPNAATNKPTFQALVIAEADGNAYVLVGSYGGAPKHPVWVHNLRANPEVEIRDRAEVRRMRVREVSDDAERARLWALSVAAYPPYEDYQKRTDRKIPLFVAEPA